MKNFKRYNFIYFVLIVALLLSGLFINVNSVLNFSHMTQKSTVATIVSPDDISVTPEVCTTEMLGHNRQILYNSQNKKNDQENFSRLYLFLIIPMYHLDSLLFYSSSNNELYHDVQSSTIIIVYIHNQDGEKAYTSL